MKKVLSIFSSVALLSGCSSIMGEPVDQDVSFDGGEIKVFSFSKAGNIDKDSIKNALVSSFENASRVHKKRHFYGDSGGKYTKGVGVENLGDSIKVTHYDNYASLYDEKSAIYKVSIDERRLDYKVTVECPSAYQDKATLRGGITKEYIPGQLAIKNFNTICTDSKPVVNNKIWIEGEFNSKFKSEDVFANFSRILSKVNNRDEVKGFDIEKAEVFTLPINDEKKTQLAVSVYPYRGGSKVVYAFQYDYKSDSSGNTSYKDSELESAKNKIIAISND